ncbi:4Fe-4S binding protein [Desulfovibrio inopinatus]|uniref:4Fe-4S binding protein n=1 Tax=Desulfovibrio inopinatus TaxID=102109 RepID=UPI000408D03C|nr:4Fe-4S binding protein [Desulfovibrio inopinatus]
MVDFRRVLQTIFLLIFWLLLGLTVFPFVIGITVQWALVFDPFLVVGTALATRTFPAMFGLGILVWMSALILGRAFCGYMCPMGATLDLVGWILRSPRKPAMWSPRLFRWKFLFLIACLAAATFGVSLVFLGSPLSLVTRFYALLLEPVASFLGNTVLDGMRTALDWVGIDALRYIHWGSRKYAAVAFVLVTFGALFWLARTTPRFWCRYLCPAGAMLGLASRRPIVRRRVDASCIDCKKCVANCPMNAIPDDPQTTRLDECILCQTCAQVCPVRAIAFTRLSDQSQHRTHVDDLSRRAVLTAASAGVGVAVLVLTGLHESASFDDGGGRIMDPTLIRPPGAVPEHSFLAACVRCGACMRVCPTNMLQPTWLASGFAGLSSPIGVPRRGPCEPLCNACGLVCPTGAIRPLILEEKMWAKMGTAHITRQKCLAWELDRKCLVCDEACPYDAISLRQVPGIVSAVPFVDENKCAGCGFCERYCPVTALPAISVEPMGAVRLASGSYAEYGRAAGLTISRKVKVAPTLSNQEQDTGELPPGFLVD